jgi:hypothetical protein
MLTVMAFGQQGNEKGPAGGKSTLRAREISSFPRRRKSMHLELYDICSRSLDARDWPSAFAAMTDPRSFYSKMESSILFHHLAKESHVVAK